MFITTPVPAAPVAAVRRPEPAGRVGHRPGDRQGPEHRHEPSEARTRDRVHEAISSDGPLTAAAIAARLGLTAAAVRRHLDALDEDGEIRAHVQSGTSRRRGRPARAYVLSEAGHRSMDEDYDDLATSALRFLADRAGEDAVAAFARERMDRLEQRYTRELVGAGKNTRARATALATALTTDGFAASARPVGEGTPLAGVQLCQGHCPVQHVAAQFPQLCDAETDAFSRLLGVHVQRLATLAHGEHVCTTYIPDSTSGIPSMTGSTTSTNGTTAPPAASPVRDHDERASR